MRNEQGTTVVQVRPETPMGRCSVCRTIYRDGAEPATDGYCTTCEPLVDDVHKDTIEALVGDYADTLVATRSDVEPFLRAGRRVWYALRAFEERFLSEISKLRREATPIGCVVIGRKDGVVRYVIAERRNEPLSEEEAEREAKERRRNQPGLTWSVHPITEGEKK